VDALRRAVERDRVAHAYLFHGPDGSGKRAAALALAQALLCERSDGRPCDTCSSCTRARRLVHPDLQFLFPQPADAPMDSVRERLDRIAADPYATVDFARRSSLDDPEAVSNRVVQYSVSRINEEVRRAMSFRSVEGGYKVAIVTDAEALRKEAANAFLKLLEEPTPNTVFILTANRLDRLLPTIVSRCQQVRFDRLGDEDVARGLSTRLGLPDSVAATIARMADGSYSRALDLAASEELLESREAAVDYLRAAYRAWSDVDRMSHQVEELARRSREHQKFQLGLMLLWIRDVVLYRERGADAAIVNMDQVQAITNFIERVPDADQAAMAELVEGAIELVERNVNSRLVLTTLAQKLALAMRGRGDARLYVPLTDD
jgi:DNA polymerase-3 subunit delta'